MGLPRTFVGFSITDIQYYRLMLAWNHEVLCDKDGFTDFQYDTSIRQTGGLL